MLKGLFAYEVTFFADNEMEAAFPDFSYSDAIIPWETVNWMMLCNTHVRIRWTIALIARTYHAERHVNYVHKTCSKAYSGHYKYALKTFSAFGCDQTRN